MKLVIYTRVSSDDQVESSSLGAQLSACRRYCKLYSHKILCEECDEGISAKDLNRPGIQRAIKRCQSGTANGIIAWRLDRITRSLHDLLGMVDEMGKQNWSLLSVTEQLDTSSPAGRLMLSMLGAFAQFERESISQRVILGMKQNLLNGKYCGERPVAGLQLIKDGESKKIILGPDADLVRPIWQMAIDGSSLSEMAKYLDKNAVKAAFRRRKSWDPASVRNLINSETAVRYGLIDEESRRLALAALAANRRDFAKKAKERHPLAGLVFCPSCQGAMVQVGAKGRGGYYQFFRCCRKIKKQCVQKDLSATKIQNKIDGVMLTALNSDNFTKLWAAHNARLYDEWQGMLAKQDRLIDEEKRLSGLLKELLAEQGKIGSEVWRASMTSLDRDLLAVKSERRAIRAQLEEAQLASEADTRWEEDRCEAIESAGLGDMAPLRRWTRLIAKVNVSPDGSASVDLIPALASLDKYGLFASEEAKAGSYNSEKLARETLKRTARSIVISLDNAGVLNVFERPASS